MWVPYGFIVFMAVLNIFAMFVLKILLSDRSRESDNFLSTSLLAIALLIMGPAVIYLKCAVELILLQLVDRLENEKVDHV